MKLKFKKMIFIGLIFLSGEIMAQQMFVNEDWNVIANDVSLINRTSSVVDNNRNLVVVSNLLNSFSNTDVLIEKYNTEGDLLWQQTFNGSYNGNDYGIKVTINNANEIFVISSIEQVTGTDFGVLKYDENGGLLWSRMWNGSADLNDIPADIAIDISGDVYVAGGTEASNGLSDYAIVKYNTDGLLLWESFYDYANLHDGATSINVKTSSVIVTGGSATTTNSWDFATLQLSKATGVINGVERTVINGVGLDKAVSICSDQNNNIYVGGHVVINGKKNIQVVKLNQNFGLEWVKNFTGGYNDVVKSIGVDNVGNVFIAGESKNSNGGVDYITIKYDSDGNELWYKLFGSGGSNQTAIAEDMKIDNSGNAIIIGTINKNGIKQFATIRYNSNGDLRIVKIYDSGSNNNEAKSVFIKDNSIYVTGVTYVNNAYKNVSIKYTVKEKNTDFIYNNSGDPIFAKNDLIVRFDISAINTININKIGFEFGTLDDFLMPNAVTQINNSLKNICPKCDITVYKIFKQLTTEDTTTLSRLGEVIPIPNFWATLLLEFPANVDVTIVADTLNSLFPLIKYTDLNFVATLNSVPNDTEYPLNQASLHSTVAYPDAHINVEPAWDIETGEPFVRVGVFDFLVDWQHEEFGDGTQTNTKIDGWSFFDDFNIFNFTPPTYDPSDPYSSPDVLHGTSCAGIIGASRNNALGIAGIAGGNDNSVFDIDSMGVSIYSIVTLPTQTAVFNYIANSIVTTSIYDTTSNNRYGLHIENHSWGFTQSSNFYSDTNLTLLTEAIHFANRAKVTVVTSRGNTGTPVKQLPASIDEDWILCVNATGTNGQFVYYDGINGNGIYNPSFGSEVDVAAPGVKAVVMTTKNTNTYGQFNGTSAAAPHVAGVASLLMSYYNKDTAHYSNLAPEDVEHILQMSADDTDTLGYDFATGYGRINAFKALDQIDKDKYHLTHFGTDNTPNLLNITLESVNDTVQLTESFENANNQWFLGQSNYVVNVFKIEASIYHNLPILDTIIDIWARPSSSNIFLPINANGKIEPRERFILNNYDQGHATLTGYIYEVFDTLGNALGWWPIDTANVQPQFTYTILNYNYLNFLNTTENDFSDLISIYPNPSQHQQTILINLKGNSKVKIGLYDLNGKMILDVFNGSLNKGEHQMSVPLNHLSNGLYVYQFVIDEKIYQYKIIKQ